MKGEERGHPGRRRRRGPREEEYELLTGGVWLKARHAREASISQNAVPCDETGIA